MGTNQSPVFNLLVFRVKTFCFRFTRFLQDQRGLPFFNSQCFYSVNWLFYRFTGVLNILTKVVVSYPVKGYSIDFHFTPSTGHNIATSKKAAVLLLLARKEQTRAAFAELKPLLACRRSAESLLVWYRRRKWNKMYLISKSAVVFHFGAVELWNLMS